MELAPPDRYAHPLSARYVSGDMERIFAPAFRFGTWRRLWLALAEAQRDLGLDIPDDAITQMRDHLDDIDLEAAARYERRFRHDVMAHIHLFGDVAPAARGILHLGATSAFVGDNTDLIQHREALTLVRGRTVGAIRALARFAREHRARPTLAYTHFQPAQPTTVGKRATLWIQDFLLDLDEIEHRLAALRLRGVRGTTGTQASFLQLFGGDHGKVDALEEAVCRRLGFAGAYPVTGQTYPRKVDQALLATLAGVAASASKMAHDIRLLSHLREVEEPFEKEQVGSSAMPYKRNPMRSERICALARHVIALAADPAQTAATQWLERTLDDSANKRLAIPDAYMATDALLALAGNVAAGLRVNAGVVEANLAAHLPFMVMEGVMMDAAAGGADRQESHERIRRHTLEAARRMTEGADSNLFERIAADDVLGVSAAELEEMARPEKLVGRAPEQVDDFLKRHVAPVLDRYRDAGREAAEVRV
ncbi:MAG: adenylosuccinate lyase [Gemmatimonadota bacterium]|nr:adenylosuccinate lyase [Gemmatimonadota bacterium]MYA11374.1 adenylosuccinate lyase [Gemmatimonadota bacterium]